MTSDAGWLAFRELDETLGPSRMAEQKLSDDRLSLTSIIVLWTFYARMFSFK